jgi:hypothetical protein
MVGLEYGDSRFLHVETQHDNVFLWDAVEIHGSF